MFVVPGAIPFTKYGELLLGIRRTSLNVFPTDVNIGVGRRRFDVFEKPGGNKIKIKKRNSSRRLFFFFTLVFSRKTPLVNSIDA